PSRGRGRRRGCSDCPSRRKQKLADEIAAPSISGTHHANTRPNALLDNFGLEGTVQGLIRRGGCGPTVCRKLDNCRNVVTVAVLAAAHFSASTLRRHVIGH